MIRRILFILLMAVLTAKNVRAQGVVGGEIAIDPVTTGIITTGYFSQFELEKSAVDHLNEILGHYRKASFATTGIYLSKQMEYRAKQRGETYYYQRIYKKVGERILPKMITLALLFFEHPDQIMTWGPYLLRTSEDVMQLCQIFECVVANGTVSFRDLPWLLINDDVRKVIELAQFGAVDWKKLFNDLADTKKIFPDSITLDVMLPDVEALWGEGKDLYSNTSEAANALINGSSDLINNSGVLNKLFTEKVKEWKKYSQQFADLYAKAEDAAAAAASFKNALEANVSFATGIMDRIKNTYGEACQMKDDLTELNLVRLANLFKFDGYSIDQYLTNFFAKLEGHYYRQKFWIEGPGVKTDKKIEYTIKPLDNFYYDASNAGLFDTEDEYKNFTCDLLSKYAPSGWYPSEARVSLIGISDVYKPWFNADDADKKAKEACNQLSGWSSEYSTKPNAKIEYHKQTMTYTVKYRIYVGMGQSILTVVVTLVGYDAVITFESFGPPEIVYEETFDSYNMDFETFYKKMEARLDNYNRQAEDNGATGKYVLKSGERQYYDDTDVRRIANATQVSFMLHCHDSRIIYKNSDSWKEDAHHNCHPNVTDQTKELAMATTLPPPSDDLGKIDEKINEYSSKADGLRTRRDVLGKQLDELMVQWNSNTNCDREALWRQITAINNEIKSIDEDIKACNDSIIALRNARAECEEDYRDTKDNTIRIPYYEHEMESAYGIEWLDPGHWEGNTRVRKGRMPNASDAILTWTAEVHSERGESWFLGIRYHRSIISVSYTLSSNTDSEVEVDVMELDMSKSEEERVKAVNDRQRALMDEYEDCTVDIKYKYAKEVDGEDVDHTIHLLWGADRLQVAREVDLRLNAIYTRMVIAERWLRCSRSILQRIRKDFREAVHRGRENRRLSRFTRRWKQAALFVGDTTGFAKFVEDEHRADQRIWYELDSLRMTGELDKILKERSI